LEPEDLARARSGEVKIWRLATKKAWSGTYHNRVDHKTKKAVTNWEYDVAIQDGIKMVNNGEKISVSSKTSIPHWIDRWAQEDRKVARQALV
jgi:hypothetical protein